MFKRKLIYPIFLIVTSCSQNIEMPESRTVQHVDNYHGTLVADPYRWLEEFTSTEVQEWVNAQNTFTESFLENPNKLAIKENLKNIWVSESISTPYKVQDKKITPPPRKRLDESMEALIHHFKIYTEGFKVPEGDAYVVVESPRGELGCYIEIGRAHV